MPPRRWSLPARSAIGVLALAGALCGAPAAAQTAQDRPQASSGAPPASLPSACPVASAPTRAKGQGEFERALEAWGNWVELRPGRWAWRPRELDPDWLPYFRGCWRWDGSSWSWVTDEPWGDVTYHFGRWTFHAAYGWVWVPGATWGPAWVVWRRDAKVVGWAPLPPAGAPWLASWTFVPVEQFEGKWIDAVAVTKAQVPALLLRMGIARAGRPRIAAAR